VPAKATRRRFNAEYKRRILRQAEACTQRGQIGALLRREGLYSSLLAAWRRQRKQAELAQLSPRKRGRAIRPNTVPAQEHETLKRENRRLRRRLQRAELIIELQKKASEMLNIPLRSLEDDESG